MKQENIDKLYEFYPKIFTKQNNPEISAGDGWYGIIEILCNHIQNYIDSKNAYIDYKIKNGEAVESDKYLQPEAVQVKEKFGGLRFYVSGGDDYIFGLIRMAESVSMMVCEVCGEKGTQTSTGWISTLCDNHKKEFKKDAYAEIKQLTTDMKDVTVAP